MIDSVSAPLSFRQKCRAAYEALAELGVVEPSPPRGRTRKANPEKRAEARRLKKIEYKRMRRRMAGAIPRAEYESSSLSQIEPWRSDGVSRRTWYRRRAA